MESIMQNLSSPMRIPIPNHTGIDFIPINTILYCHSDGNFTRVHLEKNKLVVSRNLKQMEAQLSKHNFIRIHHQYLVNANHIVRYERGDGGCIRISTGDELPVSRDGKKKFMEKLKDWV